MLGHTDTTFARGALRSNSAGRGSLRRRVVFFDSRSVRCRPRIPDQPRCIDSPVVLFGGIHVVGPHVSNHPAALRHLLQHVGHFSADPGQARNTSLGLNRDYYARQIGGQRLTWRDTIRSGHFLYQSISRALFRGVCGLMNNTSRFRPATKFLPVGRRRVRRIRGSPDAQKRT